MEKTSARLLRLEREIDRLRESEERYANMVELAAIGISHVDADGRFVHVNPRLCEMLGYTRDELLELSVRDLASRRSRANRQGSRPGCSSLAQLKRFPIDSLKIDRSFIKGIPTDKEDMAITEAILTLGKTLGVTIVAEGVETDEQQAFLQKHTCHEMQGFFFSRPIPATEFAEFYRTHTLNVATT